MWLLILSAQYTLLCALSLLLSMSAFEAATLCSPPVDRWAPPSPQAKSSSPVLLLLGRSDHLLFFASPHHSSYKSIGCDWVSVFLILSPDHYPLFPVLK